MDVRTLIPAIAAAAFAVFLLWKLRPASLIRRGPLDPRIGEVRDRAAKLTGRSRALALCEAGELCVQANRGVAAFGYFLRAARTDPSAMEPVRGMARALYRRRASLERALLRHLASLDVQGEHAASAWVALDELSKLYRRAGDRARADVMAKLTGLLPRPEGIPDEAPQSNRRVRASDPPPSGLRRSRPVSTPPPPPPSAPPPSPGRPGGDEGRG